MSRARSTTVKITGGTAFRMEDLRWFVSQTESLPPEARVAISYYKSDSRDPRESDEATLSAEVPS